MKSKRKSACRHRRIWPLELLIGILVIGSVFFVATRKDMSEAEEHLSSTVNYVKEQYGEKLYFLPYGTRAKLFTYIFKYFYLCLKTIYLYFKIIHTRLVCCHSPLGKFFYFPLIMDNVHNLGFKFLIISVVSTIIRIFKECN